ncbi:MAG: biotin carboxylase N-terminal domain-containing protein, partial [Betaproteobacteria bacterium]
MLVANRGEIAVRVMRTCARLGIRTIAVYSDADANAPHVRAADEAIRLGPAPARASYLDMDGIIAAARTSEADAVHPGYGFLSENAAFVRRCEEAGLIFVGPSADAVTRMGSKIESKRIAEAAGVLTVPGYHGDAQDADSLSAAAARIGFPVLIKASAGGGGRGMRRVDRPVDLAAAIVSARAEAEAAFGDSTVLLEKFILNPRHLEVQIAGDRQGSLVHLFERDCSVQRNNQKVLEEAPAPNLSEKTRKALHDAALLLGRAINYDSAGTVEFIMEAGDDAPYFLEMNTRLQVEHPVTEFVTGIDLVEWQLLAAAGEKLPLTQGDIRIHGHAIEARITAERADRDFQPATGRLASVVPPRGLRFDSGVETGSEIGLYYDSLLAKLIAHGATRRTALARLASGLRTLTLLGVPTTQPFLLDAINHPLFSDGQATTRFIETAFPGGWRPDPDALAMLRAAAAAYWLQKDSAQPETTWTNPWARRSAVRVMASQRPAHTTLHLSDEYGDADVDISVGRTGIAAEVGGTAIALGSVSCDGTIMTLSDAGRETTYVVQRDGDLVRITCNGLAIAARIGLKIDLQRAPGSNDRGGNIIDAPLHGVVAQIFVAVGDEVEKGSAVVQMEAMKLIHTLTAPVSGRVAAIHCNAG